MTDLGLHFRFSKMREEHGEEVASLRVHCIDFPGLADRDLYYGKVILSGPRSKGDVVKACKDRCKAFDEWADLVDDACKRMEQLREVGEPFIDLSLGEVTPAAPYLIDPLMRLEEHCLLYGMGSSGKSTIALALAMALTAGSQAWKDGIAWGFPLTARTQAIGYLDYEDSESTFKRALRGLAAGAGIPTPPVMYKRGEASLPVSAEALGRQCADLGLTGLIIDSAGLACGAEIERAESANAYFRALRTLPLSWTLTIGHQPKDKENSNYPFGSIFWWNNPRMIWKVAGVPQGDGALGIGLEHRKASHGRLEDRIGLVLSYDQEKVFLARREPRQIVGLAEHMRHPDAIPEVLREHGPMKPPDIARRAGLSGGGIYTMLKRAVEMGKIKKDGEMYVFLDPEESIPF